MKGSIYSKVGLFNTILTNYLDNRFLKAYAYQLSLLNKAFENFFDIVCIREEMEYNEIKKVA